MRDRCSNKSSAEDHATSAILYIASRLPVRSETFVYREVLGLREQGVEVRVASVRPPERDLDDKQLDRLAEEAVPVYGGGAAAMLGDAATEFCSHPLRGARVLSCGLLDALLGRDLTPDKRPKVVWQCLAGLALARRARPLGIGHIHAHMAHVPTTIAMYAAMQLGVTMSFTGHAADLFVDRAMLVEKLRRAAFVACISRWHRSFYQGLTDLPEARLPIVRCGVDVSQFKPTQQQEGGPPHVLAVGRLVEKKGFDLLLRALAALHEDGAQFRCTLVGDGPEEGKLDRLRRELGLTEVVAMVGAKSNHHVRDLMRSCDLFVLPCRVIETGDRDGIPVVLMEAMACGLSVISGDLPTIRELIDDRRMGRMVEPGNVDALTVALRELLDDPSWRGELGAAARLRVQEEFDLGLNLARLRQSFEDARATATPPKGVASRIPGKRYESGGLET